MPFTPWLLKTRMPKQSPDILFAFYPSSHTELSNEINCLSLWLSGSLSLCLSVSLSLCPSVSLSVFPLSLCLSASIPLSPSISLFFSLSMSLHAYVYLLIYTCIFTRICIYIHPSKYIIYICKLTDLNVVGWKERERKRHVTYYT